MSAIEVLSGLVLLTLSSSLFDSERSITCLNVWTDFASELSSLTILFLKADSRCAPSALRRRVRLVTGKLGQGLLARGFASHERDEVFRRVGGRDSHAERFHALAERLRLNNFVQLLVEISDNGCWRLGRCGEADEASMIEIRIAKFIHRWHLGPALDLARARNR